MALDFSNKNPQDPNGIYSLDTSTAQEAWVKDKDWSQIYYDAASAKKAGANNKVKLATAITNDGKKYNVIVGADGTPISQVGDTTGQDDDTAARWKQQQTQANKPPEERNNNGRRERWNPSTSTWDDVGAAINTTAPAAGTKEWRPEGTPTGQKDASGNDIYDNSRLTMAAYVGGKRTGETRQPTSDEIKDWNEAGQRTRNPGGKTDKEIQDEKDKAEATARQNRPTVRIEDDGQGGVVAISVDPTTGVATPRPIPGVRGKPQQVTVDGTVYERGADGTYKPAAGLPDKNAPLPAGVPKYTPDYNKDDLGLTDYNEQLMEYARLHPEFQRSQGRQLLEQAGALATQTASHGTTLRSQQATARGQDITQRGQDIGEVASRRSSADSGFDNLWNGMTSNARYLGRGGGDIAGQAFTDALMARQAYATQAGGYADVPRVAPALRAGAGVPGSESTQVQIGPDGNVQVSPPGSPPPGAAVGAVGQGVTATTAAAVNPTGANVQAANDATMQGSSAAFGALGVPQQRPPSFIESTKWGPQGGAPVSQVPPYLQPARTEQQWTPDPVVAKLRDQGFSDDEINEALRMHQESWAA